MAKIDLTKLQRLVPAEVLQELIDSYEYYESNIKKAANANPLSRIVDETLDGVVEKLKTVEGLAIAWVKDNSFYPEYDFGMDRAIAVYPTTPSRLEAVRDMAIRSLVVFGKRFATPEEIKTYTALFMGDKPITFNDYYPDTDGDPHWNTRAYPRLERAFPSLTLVSTQPSRDRHPTYGVLLPGNDVVRLSGVEISFAPCESIAQRLDEPYLGASNHVKEGAFDCKVEATCPIACPYTFKAAELARK